MRKGDEMIDDIYVIAEKQREAKRKRLKKIRSRLEHCRVFGVENNLTATLNLIVDEIERIK